MQSLKRQVWLVVGSKKNRYSGKPDALALPRVSGGKKPTTKGDEIAIALTIELPKALFLEPQFKAAISVPGDDVCRPQIEAEVIENIEQIVGEATGLTLTIESEVIDE